MSPDTLPWIIALASTALLAAAGTLWALRQRKSEPAPLPDAPVDEPEGDPFGGDGE